MASLAYVLCARGADGNPLAGLTPSWKFLKLLADGSDVIMKPAITEIGFGQYKFNYDPEATGDASGQVFMGATANERYVDVTMYRTESRLDSNLDAAVSSRSTYNGGPVASVTAPVVASSVTSPVKIQPASLGLVIQ